MIKWHYLNGFRTERERDKRLATQTRILTTKEKALHLRSKTGEKKRRCNGPKKKWSKQPTLVKKKKEEAGERRKGKSIVLTERGKSLIGPEIPGRKSARV